MFKKAAIAFWGMLLSLQVMASGAILINGKEIKNREQLQGIFAKQLNFIQVEGKGADIIYENLISDNRHENIIKIKHVHQLKAKLGTEYVDSIIQAILDAEEDNPRIVLVLE